MEPTNRQSNDAGRAGRSVDGLLAPDLIPEAQSSLPQMAPNASSVIAPGAPQPAPVAKPSKHYGTALAISLALVITTTLIVLASFVFISTRKKPTTAPQTSTTTQGRLSSSDIDAVNQAIDQNLNNVSDNKDFSPNDLSDSALGL